MRKTVEVQVPAKVNLQLSVGPKKANGYHDVVTVFQANSLMDTLNISHADQFGISIKGDYTNGVPLDKSNLVYKAVELMSEKFDTDAIIPLVNKLGQFLSDPLLRNIFGQKENKIDISNFTSGLYFISVKQGQQIYTQKLIKQ